MRSISSTGSRSCFFRQHSSLRWGADENLQPRSGFSGTEVRGFAVSTLQKGETAFESALASLSKDASFTKRERDVCLLLLSGMDDKSISYALSISRGRVRQVIYSSFRKLGISCRNELIRSLCVVIDAQLRASPSRYAGADYKLV